MPEQTDAQPLPQPPPRPPGSPPGRSILGSRLANRQAASAQPPGDQPDESEDADRLPPSGVNRGALLSRLRGSHSSDLARGFRALLSAGLAHPDDRPAASAVSGGGAPAGELQIRLINLASIQPNPVPPRTAISADSIARLARSIREIGILQPLVVMPAPQTGPGGAFSYRIVSGERRRQAALQAGLVDVPAIVREIAPGAALQLLLAEDLHRVPLRPLDRARLCARLIQDLHLPISEVAARLGVSAADVENMIKILALDPDMIETIESGQISEAQAERLSQVADPTLRRRLWRRTIRYGWSPERMAAALARWGLEG